MPYCAILAKEVFPIKIQWKKDRVKYGKQDKSAAVFAEADKYAGSDGCVRRRLDTVL